MLPSFLPHETTKLYFPNTDILFLLNTDCTDNTDIPLTTEFYFLDHGKHGTHGRLTP